MSAHGRTLAAAPRTRRPTWEMTADELARTVAYSKAWEQDGGWLFIDATPIAQGYGQLAAKLVRLGIIEPGRGIDWRRLDATPAERIRRTVVR